MKKILIVISILLATVIIVGFAAYRWWSSNTAPVSQSSEVVNFTIPRGYSASQVGEKLYKERLIRNPLAFKIYVQFFDKTKRINAGRFGLSEDMDLFEIIKKLQGGPLEIWVTIPEGLRKEEIVEIFIKSLHKGDSEAQEFREEFLDLASSKEGNLFPDTYLFPPEASASIVVNKLTDTFEKKIDSDMREDLVTYKYSLFEVVTMASIIEREAKSNEERPVIAGILWKRLETPGWLLQADASVQYGVANVKCQMSLRAGGSQKPEENVKCDNWWPILTKEDLQLDSPYNLYKYKDLPPTPISNPGIVSIKAALYPQDSSYWFYIHDANGVIHYAEDITEHNRNVKVYLGKD